MSGEREYLDYVQDMLDSAENALEFVAGMGYDQFASDKKTHFAVVRAIEIIGEAAKKNSERIARNVLRNSMARNSRDERQTHPRLYWCQFVRCMAHDTG